MSRRVGIWIRVSTEDQEKGGSPEHHTYRAKAYAAAKGWEVVEEYHPEATSGKDARDHAEMNRMLEDLRSGRITGLIFSKLARLARSTRALLELAELFRERNADLISLEESIDTSTPAGRLFFTLIAALTEWEREEIAARVIASIPVRAKLGKPTGGPAVFGYQWLNQKLVPKPEDAAVRVLIYELYREHQRLLTVARLLNERGYRTRRGKLYTDMAIRWLIEDTTAKGLHCSNVWISAGRTANRQPGLKPESEWVYNQVEPIVPLELWEACNQILSQQRAKHKKAEKIAVYPFSGLLYCHCGGKLYSDVGKGAGRKYRCQRCRNAVSAEGLDLTFQQEFTGFFSGQSAIDAQAQHTQDTLTTKEGLLISRLKELAKVKAAREKLLSAYLDSHLSAQQFGAHDAGFVARQAALEIEIPALEGAIDFLRVQQISAEQTQQDARTLSILWGDFADSEKQAMLRHLLGGILVKENEIEFDLTYSPRLFELAGQAATHKQNDPKIPTVFLTIRNHDLVRVKLTAAKPSVIEIPLWPQPGDGWGNHLRYARWERGLTRRATAHIIGVSVFTLRKWETGRQPLQRLIPAIIAFLGYCPLFTRPAGLSSNGCKIAL